MFKALSDDTLLKKCLHGGTQNSNESFHHPIWDRCPKTVFVGRDRLQIAVDDASIVFNDGEMGRLDVFRNLNLSIGVHQVSGFQTLDKKRITAANIQCQESSKVKRVQRSLAAAQKEDKTEGYGAGAF